MKLPLTKDLPFKVQFKVPSTEYIWLSNKILIIWLLEK